MAYSIDPISDNCYPGTTVLVNKFDIRDDAKLNEVETVLVSARDAEWTEHPTVDSFDFAHYKAAHHFLFSDLYDWAGQIRTVNISKKGTRFCPAEEIEQRAFLAQLIRNAGYDINWADVDGDLLMIATLQAAQG